VRAEFECEGPLSSADERSVFFQRANLLTSGSRAQLTNDFGAPTELAELRPFAEQFPLESPAVNGDASVLVFGAKDGGDVNLWLTRRGPSANLFEATATELVALNTGSIERGAAFSADGTRLYFSSNRLGPFGEGEGQDSIFVSTILGDNTFSAPFALKDPTTSNGLLIGYNPTPTADGKSLYFARRVPSVGDHVYIGELAADGTVNDVQAIRGTNGGTFSVPASNEYPGFISADNCRLYFSSDALGDPDLYVASRRGR
jgi:Tol biopolymer transport system component